MSGLEQFCGMIARGETIRRDDYALTRGQSVVLDHPVGTEAVECFVELGRIVDDLAVSGLDAGDSHHVLGESLRSLDAGGVGRRPEAGDTCCAHRVCDTEDQRNLGSDDDEVGFDLLGQRGNRVTRSDVDGVLLGDFCDPGIARRADQGRDTWIASKREKEGMFTGSGADY